MKAGNQLASLNQAFCMGLTGFASHCGDSGCFACSCIAVSCVASAP